MNRQTLLVSEEGLVLQSQGQLLPRHWLLHRSIRGDFPLLDSLWTALVQLPHSRFPIYLHYVESPHPSLKGFYTLSIEKISPIASRFKLTITDRTKEAQKHRKELQRRNEELLKQDQRTLLSLLS